MSDIQNNSVSNRPTHRLYHVTGEGDDARWNRIGAAWPHSDGKGFNLDIEYTPVKPGRIVLREAKQDQAEA